MKLEDHVEKIRIKVEEAVKNTLDRCGITMNGNTYAQQKVNGISIGNVEQLVQSIQSEKSEWIDWRLETSTICKTFKRDRIKGL